MSAAAYIDGVSADAIAGSVTPRLNAPSQAELTVPMHLAAGDIGSKGKFVLDGVLAFHGRCTNLEVTAGEDTGYVKYVFTDALELWDKRPARDPDGDFSKPSFIQTYVTAPQIMQAILTASESAGGGPPADAEGDLEVQLGTFQTGGKSLVGAPTDWPMTIAEVASLLISTGQLDIVAVPIDNGTDTARIDCYNGAYGTDRTGSVVLQYGMGAYNIASLKWTKDLQDVVNKIWTYLGPRVQTAADPPGDQHWDANIVSTDPGLSDPPKSAVNARRVASQADYLVRMLIQIYDARGDEAIVAHDLYRWNWLAESWIRAMPKELVHVTPLRGAITFGDFGVGDLITVQAANAVMGGFSGAQRIYEYTASWDADSIIAVTDLQTSAGNEGFS